MKKISLKDVKNGLKRDEMRMISGGSGQCNATNPCSSDGDCGGAGCVCGYHFSGYRVCRIIVT